MTIIANKIQCNVCKDIIESKHTHDFVWCKCQSQSLLMAVSLTYAEQGDIHNYTDLSEVTDEDKV
jgi:hypothetical protein